MNLWRLQRRLESHTKSSAFPKAIISMSAGGAGSDYHAVTKLEPGAGGILLGTKRVTKGDTTWQEITFHGQTGWVNAAYIGLETQVPTPPTRSPAESSTSP